MNNSFHVTFLYVLNMFIEILRFILKSYDILLRNPPKYRALSLDEEPFREDFDFYQIIKRQN